MLAQIHIFFIPQIRIFAFFLCLVLQELYVFFAGLKGRLRNWILNDQYKILNSGQMAKSYMYIEMGFWTTKRRILYMHVNLSSPRAVFINVFGNNA